MRIYTVVDVMSGVSVGVKSFRRFEQARICLKRRSKGRNLDQDDIQLFEDTVLIPAKRRRAGHMSMAPSAKSRTPKGRRVPDTP
jgi:hypothetical protein